MAMLVLSLLVWVTFGSDMAVTDFKQRRLSTSNRNYNQNDRDCWKWSVSCESFLCDMCYLIYIYGINWSTIIISRQMNKHAIYMSLLTVSTYLIYFGKSYVSAMNESRTNVGVL